MDIARETERVNLLVDFQDASTITESQLDLATRQAFYLAQEAFDLTNSTLAVADDGSYSASNRRISLLGDPNSDDDAVNQGWVKAQFNSGYDAHLERIAAENAEENAHDSEIKASSSEVNAEESADKAKTSEQNAKSSETHSATSEQNSKTSETNAAQSAEEARGYADSVNLPSPVGNAGKVLISDGSDWVLSTVTLDSLIQRIAVLEAKTARQSVSGSITVFNGEVRATDISIGN